VNAPSFYVNEEWRSLAGLPLETVCEGVATLRKTRIDADDELVRVVTEKEYAELQAAKQDSELLDWLEANKGKLFGIYPDRTWRISAAVKDGETGAEIIGESQTLRAAIKAAQAGRAG